MELPEVEVVYMDLEGLLRGCVNEAFSKISFLLDIEVNVASWSLANH